MAKIKVHKILVLDSNNSPCGFLVRDEDLFKWEPPVGPFSYSSEFLLELSKLIDECNVKF
jgi:hypothetical protein